MKKKVKLKREKDEGTVNEIDSLRRKLFLIYANMSAGKEKNLKKARAVRREIAQLMTMQSKKSKKL